ncbi:MAG TPA: HAD-IA family hydrolase [Candidatus Saccharimonadales bacterium]|nr:HAD-IA family hydrolase [Candidatus Saccharimonadales bacterium]
MDEKALGKRLAQARRQAKMTQQELCQKAGLSYSTLAKIERGAIRSPSVFTVASIAAATGVSLEELLNIELNKRAGDGTDKKRSKTGVSFVFLDVNGVLVRFFHRAFGQIAQEAAVSADIVETLFWRHNDAVCRGELSYADFNGIFADELGLSGFDWKHYYMANIEAMPGIDALVDWIAGSYRLGLLTNNMPGFTRELLSQGVIPRVDYELIIDSAEVKSIKPEDKIYEIAQAKAGVSAQEILLIDDGRSNLMAADRLGWHVLWFDDYRPEEGIERARQVLEF